ncbi:uncharacterized protein B0H18DRAFT_1115890 [Fomitopsis serialis]|uniref:uncharacterized protein n=1 Tax=Fomitopsis serialis TaxID=139415 RepID=UPI0020087BCF|nr:uncharacterized protein B0H18DRAFT_1115890 [Neoantrodia serialis]KAH9932196.1 hypothetical protein B0H18DRAFT_1115890 [Neoantrodia serialis]
MSSIYPYSDEVAYYLLHGEANHSIDIPYSLPPDVEDMDTPMGMYLPGYGPCERTPYLNNDPGLYNDLSYPRANPNSGPYTEVFEYDLQYASEAEQLASASHQQSADVEAPPDVGNGHTDHTSSEPGPAPAHVDQASTVAGGVIAAIPVICRFGAGPFCFLDPDALLRKTSGVESHLLEYHRHGPTPVLVTDCGKFACQWDDENGHCSRKVRTLKQLAKHIATVHLRLFNIRCEGCDEVFSRPDALKRHKEKGRCPGKQLAFGAGLICNFIPKSWSSRFKIEGKKLSR